MKKSVSFFKGIIVDVKHLETSSVFSYAVKHFLKKKRNLRRLYGERQLMCPYFNHFSTSFCSITFFLPSKRFLQNQPTNRVGWCLSTCTRFTVKTAQFCLDSWTQGRVLIDKDNYGDPFQMGKWCYH